MDYKIFQAINQFASRYQLLDTVMITISQKMRYLLTMIFILMCFLNKLQRKITKLVVISGAITLLLEFIIKRFYFKPRPFVKHSVNVLPPTASRTSSSFPSKHTTLTFVAATCVMSHKRFLGAFMYILALLTGLSRIWMGQHYPSDIIGSALLGSFTSKVVNTILGKK